MGLAERPKPLCFGNIKLDGEQCTECLDWADCIDDLAGWGISTFLSDFQRSELTEELIGVPQWVFEWDLLSEGELNKLMSEEPNRSKIFNKLNNSIVD